MKNRFRTSRHATFGFSLLELMVVMAIVSILLGLLMPSLQSVRHTAYRVISAGNQRTLGQGLTMWAGAHDGELPPSRVLDESNGSPALAELMRVYAPRADDDTNGPAFAQRRKRHKGYELALDDKHWHNWDGLGHLFASGLVKAPEVFYSPAHWGEHPFRRYREDWVAPDPSFPDMQPDHTIYCNYHYSGHHDDRGRETTLDRSPTAMVSVDGLRRRSDLNHKTGVNVLRADSSVAWQDDQFLLGALPQDDVGLHAGSHNELIRTLWNDPWQSGKAFWIVSDPDG